MSRFGKEWAAHSAQCLRDLVWSDFLESGVTASATDFHRVRDLRILNTMLLVAMALCPVLGLFWASIASDGFVALYATSFAAWSGILFFLRKTRNPVASGRLACLTLHFLIAGSAVLLGGTSSFSLAWFMVMPVAATACVGKVDLWFWTGASAATVYLFSVLPPLPNVGPGIGASASLGDPSSLSSLIAGVFVVAVLTSVWHALQSDLETRLDVSLRATREEVQQKEILVEIATVSSSEESVDAAAQLFVERLSGSFDIVAARFWSLSEEAASLQLISCVPRPTRFDFEAPQAVRDCAMENRRIIQRGDDSTSVCVPVLRGSQVLGVLEILGDGMSDDVSRYAGVVAQMALRLKEVGLRQATARAAWNQAHQDYLTRLPNRRAFNDVLRNALSEAKMEKRRTALLFVDLNGFKQINDQLGHAAGDEVLKLVSRRLKTCLRLSDALCESEGSSGTQLSRIGGDEFTIVLDEIHTPADAELVAERVIGSLAESVTLERGDVQVGASVGISIYPDDAESMEELVRCADAAMYTAKRLGGARFARYQRYSEHEVEIGDAEFKEQMREALEEGAFEMHYQPVFRCSDGALVAAEALMRWCHPDKGALAPELFIPIAERMGMMGELGRFQLESALDWMSGCRAHLPADFRLALNISALQIEDPAFVPMLTSQLAVRALDANEIELEVNEAALLGESETARGNLDALSAMGIRIALDNFGVGHGALSLLKRFPIDRIKLDRSFVAGLPDEADDAAIAMAVIGLAAAMDLPLVAEGVEDEAQQLFLAERGCKEMQGFLLGRPVPGEEFALRFG